MRSKNVSITIYFHKKIHFAATSKENKKIFAKKIRGFVDSEFVKTCHEQVINSDGASYFQLPKIVVNFTTAIFILKLVKSSMISFLVGIGFSVFLWNISLYDVL